jgi:predicted ATPase/class 3 adenylate cyclase
MPLPTGTITFLFTDIEGSTRLWEQQPEPMRAALARHDALAATLVEAHGGTLVKSRGEGDSLFAVFPRATDALAAAAAFQQALVAEPWPAEVSLRVRIALHTGEADLREGSYYGGEVNRCARLRAVAHGGQVLLSRTTYDLVRDALPEGASLRDLGEQRLRDLTRPEHVFQLLHPSLPADFPPLNTLETRPNNLPVQLTPLIGREQEVKAVQELLRREEVRLVTLTGPGGTGKTRLAQQVAADMLDDFADGVYFVDLAPLTDPGLVTSAVAPVLKVRETGSTPLLESLKASLHAKQLLLVLDNFEQILDAAPLVTDLLTAAPGLKVLVTSRAVLRLRGEHEYPVPPLSLPDPKQLPSSEALSKYAAVELFSQRALAARPDFMVTNENAPAVAEICVRLDGLPLAIELAAARVKLFPPQAMLRRLDRPLKLLIGGARDVPGRHQTLRGTIAWSYGLLGEEEQKLFRRVSVFTGGCTMQSAEAVCTTDGDLGLEILDGVASLLDKSLLWQAEGMEDEPRFTMLETIREFGLEQLEASGESPAIRDQHAQFFLALAEQADAGAGGTVGRERLESEHHNLRAALDWAVQTDEAILGLRLSTALAGFWQEQGYHSEGQERLAAVLALPGAQDRTALRARALRTRGSLVRYQVDGGLAQARSLYEESLAIWRDLGDRQEIANGFYTLGRLALDEEDLETASSLIEESLARLTELGNQRGISVALNGLGIIAMHRGDYERARSLYEQVTAIRRELGDRSLLSWSIFGLGWVAVRQGDWSAARAHYLESLAIQNELGIRAGLPTWFDALARIAAAEGAPERAARLFGAAEALRDAMGMLRSAPVDRADYERDVAAARAQLDETAFSAAWAEGRAMTPDQAVADALGDGPTE